MTDLALVGKALPVPVGDFRDLHFTSALESVRRGDDDQGDDDNSLSLILVDTGRPRLTEVR
jgi:hypothetical protein